MIIKKLKAQTAIEFVILVSFILFFFTLFFIAIQGNSADKIRERQNLRIKEIALTFQNEIDLALESSDGYYREFRIPDEIDNKDYDISITEDMVYVRTQDNKYAIALPVAKVTGDAVKGSNIIRKENGEISLNS